MNFEPNAVYLIGNDWSENNYKIGFSNNPIRRCLEIEDQYENVNPQVLSTCWLPTRRLAQRAERIWHSRMKRKSTDDHGGKEWFSLASSDINEFQIWCDEGMSCKDIKQWIFRDGTPSYEVISYGQTLLSKIPRKPKHNRVDTWFAESYQQAFEDSINSLINQTEFAHV